MSHTCARCGRRGPFEEGFCTHQGGQQQRYLDRYIDEFVFRFNRRSSHNPGLLFDHVLEEAMTPETHLPNPWLRRPSPSSDR